MESQDVSCAQQSPGSGSDGPYVVKRKAPTGVPRRRCTSKNIGNSSFDLGVESTQEISSDEDMKIQKRGRHRVKRRIERPPEVNDERDTKPVDLDLMLEDISLSELESHDFSVRGARPYNCFGGLAVDKDATYYRCNFQTAISDLGGLKYSEAHCELMKNTPMWFLFDGIRQNEPNKLHKRMRKSDDAIREVLRRYNTENGGFVIGKKILKLTKLDVQLVLGVYGGSQKIKTPDVDYQASPWVRRCFPNEVKRHEDGVQTLSLYKSHFKKKIDRLIVEKHEIAEMDVARLTICYLLNAILCPTRSGTIPNHILGFLEVFSCIKDFDWADHVLETLIYHINQTKTMKLSGCAMLLLFFLCEHLNILDPIANDAFPRFLRWDLTRLYTTLSKRPVHEFKSNEVDAVTGEPTVCELLKFKVLRRHWETDGKHFLDMYTSAMSESSDDGNDVSETQFTPNETDTVAYDVGEIVCNGAVLKTSSPMPKGLQNKAGCSNVSKGATSPVIEVGIDKPGPCDILIKPGSHSYGALTPPPQPFVIPVNDVVTEVDTVKDAKGNDANSCGGRSSVYSTTNQEKPIGPESFRSPAGSPDEPRATARHATVGEGMPCGSPEEVLPPSLDYDDVPSCSLGFGFSPAKLIPSEVAQPPDVKSPVVSIEIAKLMGIIAERDSQLVKSNERLLEVEGCIAKLKDEVLQLSHTNKSLVCRVNVLEEENGRLIANGAMHTNIDYEAMRSEIHDADVRLESLACEKNGKTERSLLVMLLSICTGTTRCGLNEKSTI